MHEVHFHGVVPPVYSVLAASVPVKLDQIQPAAIDCHASTRLHIDLDPPHGGITACCSRWQELRLREALQTDVHLQSLVYMCGPA